MSGWILKFSMVLLMLCSLSVAVCAQSTDGEAATEQESALENTVYFAMGVRTMAIESRGKRNGYDITTSGVVSDNIYKTGGVLNLNDSNDIFYTFVSPLRSSPHNAEIEIEKSEKFTLDIDLEAFENEINVLNHYKFNDKHRLILGGSYQSFVIEENLSDLNSRGNSFLRSTAYVFNLGYAFFYSFSDEIRLETQLYYGIPVSQSTTVIGPSGVLLVSTTSGTVAIDFDTFNPEFLEFVFATDNKEKELENIGGYNLTADASLRYQFSANKAVGIFLDLLYYTRTKKDVNQEGLAFVIPKEIEYSARRYGLSYTYRY